MATRTVLIVGWRWPACEWAATTPACANGTFNINNGDVVDWRHVWPAIAETLGMEVGPPALAAPAPGRV